MKKEPIALNQIKITVLPLTPEERAARMSPMIVVTVPIFVTGGCEECGDEMADTVMDHLVEAYEVTGRILCDGCFADYREEGSASA